MSATEEQMALMAAANVSHVSYILLLYSASFLLFLFVCMLLHLYAKHVFPLASKSNPVIADGPSIEGGERRLRSGSSARIVRDADEFELEGLMSDDEEVVGMNGKMTTTTAPRNGIVVPRTRAR